MIKFRCTHCGQEITVPVSYAGKNIKCPKCQNIVVIPKAENTAPVADQSDFSDSKGGTKYAGFDHALFDIPPEDAGANQLSSQDGVSEKNLEELHIPVEKTTIDEAESFGARKLPFFIDIFLYPLSFCGLVNLALIIAVPFLLDFLQKIMIIQLSCLFFLIALIIKIMLFLFMYWYFAECVRDSAEGGLRAPNVRGDVPGAVDMFLQMVNIIGCLLIFFMPFVIYVLAARRIDIFFWLLLIYAVFFFPMALLAVVVLDSPAGLNPRLLYNSISITFLQYCGLVFLIVAAILLIGTLGQKWGESGYLAFVVRGVSTYMVFVAAHLLGRFYWRNQEKLNWEV